MLYRLGSERAEQLVEAAAGRWACFVSYCAGFRASSLLAGVLALAVHHVYNAMRLHTNKTVAALVKNP